MADRALRGMGLLAAVLVFVLAIAGCGSPEGDLEEAVTDRDGDESAPTEEGDPPEDGAAAPDVSAPSEFRYAELEPTGPIDPRLVAGPSLWMTNNLFEGLIRLDPEGEIEYIGATDLEVSDDGLVYTFTLRPEVTWSDGAPVTAQDYWYALTTTLDPETASLTADLLHIIENAEAYNAGEIDDPAEVGVDVLDDHTLRLRLAEPSGQAIANIATAPTFMPVPRHVIEEHGERWTEAEHIVTNGPLTLDEWRHEQSVLMVPNDHYWGEPATTPVGVQLVADPGAQGLTLFEAGEVDFAVVSSAEVDRIEAHPEWGEMLRFTAVPRLYALFKDHRVEPFDDERVRRALYLAIDRDLLAQATFSGMMSPAYGVIPHEVPAHSQDIRIEGTLDDARALLAEAGFPDGDGFPTMELALRSSREEELMAQAIQAMWREGLGIDIRLTSLEPAAFRELDQSYREGEPFEMILRSATASAPDPWLFHNFMIGPGGEGYYPVYWADEDYAALLPAAEAELDLERRIERYQELERLVVEAAAVLPVVNENLAYLVRPTFTNVEIPWGMRSPGVTAVRFDGQG